MANFNITATSTSTTQDLEADRIRLATTVDIYISINGNDATDQDTIIPAGRVEESILVANKSISIKAVSTEGLVSILELAPGAFGLR
jgi:uncharacterized protein YpmB